MPGLAASSMQRYPCPYFVSELYYCPFPPKALLRICPLFT